MNFNQLVASIQYAHEYLLERAASAINQSLTIRNWLYGFYIVEYEQNGEDRAKYGDKLLSSLSKSLRNKGMKGYSQRNLHYYRQFYIIYPGVRYIILKKKLQKEILQTASAKLELAKHEEAFGKMNMELLVSKLSFSHFVILIRENNPIKRNFYEAEAIKGNWSVRELERQIGSLLFERTGMSGNKNKLIKITNINAEKLTPSDIIRDPYVFEFLGLKQKDVVREVRLEKLLLDHLQEFLLELGRGFCFEARQKRITVDNVHFFIDLVFYHRILKCHVLIDLKLKKFSHVDAGQMNFYLNYYIENEMNDQDNLPVGMLLCSDKDESTVKYSIGNIDNKVFVSRYKVELPVEEELKQLIENDKKNLGL